MQAFCHGHVLKQCLLACSGILASIVASPSDGTALGALGLIFYRDIIGIESLPRWDISVARTALSTQPNALASQNCNNNEGTTSAACPLTFSLSYANQQTVTNAYALTNSYASTISNVSRELKFS